MGTLRNFRILPNALPTTVNPFPVETWRETLSPSFTVPMSPRSDVEWKWIYRLRIRLEQVPREVRYAVSVDPEGRAFLHAETPLRYDSGRG